MESALANIPQEILCHIFSFLSRKEQCRTVANVNRTWNLASSLLRKKVKFKVNPRYPPPPLFKNIFDKSPLLVNVIMVFYREFCWTKETLIIFLQTIAERCPQLKHLTLVHCDGLSKTSLEIVIRGCPELERLDVIQSWNLEPGVFYQLAKLSNLTHLDWPANLENAEDILLAIAKNCKRISYLNIFTIKISDTTLVEVLRYLADSLENLYINGIYLNKQSHRVLAVCRKLKQLIIHNLTSVVGLEYGLSTLLNLSFLELKGAAGHHTSAPRIGECLKHLPRLEYLDLCDLDEFDDSIFDVLVVHCSNLTCLKLYGYIKVTRYGVQNFLDQHTKIQFLNFFSFTNFNWRWVKRNKPNENPEQEEDEIIDCRHGKGND